MKAAQLQPASGSKQLRMATQSKLAPMSARRGVVSGAAGGSEPAVQPSTNRRPLIDLSSAGAKGPEVSRRALVVPPMLAGLATCACCAAPSPAFAWGYENGGALQWGGACSTGQLQSPIDLPVTELIASDSPAKHTNKFGEIIFNYKTNEQTMVMNTGHGTMQVIFPPGNTASVGGMEMELLQFHFHTPSEHSLDGMRSPMEVHLVHKVVSTGSLAVVGVLIEGGAPKPHGVIQTAFEYAPAPWRVRTPKAQVLTGKPITPALLLPEAKDGRRSYVHYSGSLTTPPCSEGVDWFVMTQPILATDEQILDFMHYVGKGLTYTMNSRPIQKNNSRSVEYDLTNWGRV